MPTSTMLGNPDIACVPCNGAGAMPGEKDPSIGGSSVLCTACRVRVVGSKALRSHYQSEHHRVNLSRKILGLEPLSIEEVNIRIAHARAEEMQKNTKESMRRQGAYCVVCSKRFSSEKALQNHCRSRRHLDAVHARPMSEISLTDGKVSFSERDETNSQSDAAMDTKQEDDNIDMDVEQEQDNEEEEVDAAFQPTVCPFDGYENRSVQENATYMASKFGFFIPYVESLVDMEGLFEYLNMKVERGFICIKCDKQFDSTDAVRRHMIAKQHCAMTDHDEVWAEEFAEFYDFDKEVDTETEEDGDGYGEWIEVDEDEKIPEDAVVMYSDPKLRKAQALEAVRPALDADQSGNDGELVGLVVNGKVVGHRSLKRYYRQSYSAGGNKALVAHVKREYRLFGASTADGNEEISNAVRRKELARKRRLELKNSKSGLMASRKERFHLRVGASNYYTRKSKLKPSMAVFNSGYRP